MRRLFGWAFCILATTAANAKAPASGPSGGKVYTSNLITRWGRQVTPGNVWQSYPRPQMKRAAWKNLNGLWDYAITSDASPLPARMDGQILVPFPVESKLSRVARKVMPDDRVWYRRQFTVPKDWAGQHVQLNFGAVDFAATVWVNGAVAGSHQGGFDAFGFDITDYLKPGANELVVQVADPNSAGSQPRGKQSLDPSGIWYTAASGIWQTVWIEPTPKLHIADVRATPDIDRGVVDVDVALSNWASDTDAVRLTARSGGEVIASTILRANRHATLAIPNAHLWSPDDPFLYDLTAELVTVRDPYAGLPGRDHVAYDARFTRKESETYAAAQVEGEARDRVETYFGMRKISVGPGPVAGQPALLLNNKPLFENGTLDQGWWPDGLITPPSEEAMKSDLVFLKQAGFNMWSEGGWTGPDYSVAYAMGPSPTGPFRPMGKILKQDFRIARGAGHHSVVNVPGTDDWYIVYHRRPLGDDKGEHRQLAIDHMEFNADGTIRPVVMTNEGVKPRPLAQPAR